MKMGNTYIIYNFSEINIISYSVNIQISLKNYKNMMFFERLLSPRSILRLADIGAKFIGPIVVLKKLLLKKWAPWTDPCQNPS